MFRRDDPKHKKILDVPVYTQSSKAPLDGWCGHTSLQMILEYYGDSYTQEEINSANSQSDSPTIYFQDMVPTIEKLTNNNLWINRAIQIGKIVNNNLSKEKYCPP